MTVNVELVAVLLLTVTPNVPVVAPDGTRTVMLVVDQVKTEAVVEPNTTVLVPWLAPNPLPVIVTGMPTGPDVGEIAEMLGD